MSAFAESVVEEAALAWLGALGYTVHHGPDIACGEPGAERRDAGYRDVVLERCFRDALAPMPWKTHFASSRARMGRLSKFATAAVHRLLVDGVAVEYRANDGSVRGAQATVRDADGTSVALAGRAGACLGPAGR